MPMLSNNFNKTPNQVSQSRAPEDDDSAWTVEMRLHTREQAIKVAAYLAKCIDKKQITQKGLLMGVWGGFLTGKSLIIDAFAMGLIDEANPYKVPKNAKMFLEEHSGQAASEKVEGRYLVQEKELSVSFRNFGNIKHPIITCDYKNESDVALLTMKYAHEKGEVLYTTEERSDIAKEFGFSILIVIQKTELGYSDMWLKDWSIHIAPEFRTPEMRKALDHLRNVNERINARHAALGL